MSIDRRPQASSPWLASEPVSFRGPLPTRPPYSLKLNYQMGRFPKVSSPSLWTHGPQLCLLSFACPRMSHQTPRVQRGLGCARPGSPLVTSLPLPQLGGTSQPASLAQLRSVPRPPRTQAPFSWHPFGAKPWERPASLQACSIQRLPGGPELWARWAAGLGPAFCSPLLARGWPRPPHPALLRSSSFTILFSVVGPASSALNSDKCYD